MFKIPSQSQIKQENKEKEVLFENVPLCNNCNSTELTEDPHSGTILCMDCGVENSGIIDNNEGGFRSNHPGDTNMSRCGAPINILFPKSSSSISLGSYKYKNNRHWQTTPYNERKMLENKKKMENITKNILTDNLREQALLYIKKIREKEKHLKDIDNAFMAVSTYIVCRTNGVDRTPQSLMKLFDVNLSNFNRCSKLFEKNMPHLTVIFRTSDKNFDNTGTNIAENIGFHLKLDKWIIDCCKKILQLMERNGLITNIVVKNRVAVIYYYIVIFLNLNITLEKISELAENVTPQTVEGHYKVLKKECKEGMDNIITFYKERKDCYSQ